MRADTNDALPPEVERELDAVDRALAGQPVQPELASLAALARALRDERPEPEPFFTRDLDARAAAGFPPREREGRHGGVGRWFLARPMAIPGVAASALLALVVSIALISGGFQSGDEEEGAAGAGGQAAPPPGAVGGHDGEQALERDSAALEPDSAGAGRAPAPAASTGGSASRRAPSVARRHLSPTLPPPGGGSPGSDARTERKVETSASLTLAAPADSFDRTADEIVRVTDAVGGFVVTSAVESTDGGTGNATFQLRVPSGRLQAALAQLSRLAHVRERQQATQDITAEHASARERLADARAERKALLRQLGNADTQTEIDSLKARLRDVGYRIRAAKADRARVNNRARFSNVSVTLLADRALADEGEEGGVWTPGDAARDALRVLEVAAGVLLVGLAALAPLILLGLLAIPIARWAARRRRERALGPA